MAAFPPSSTHVIPTHPDTHRSSEQKLVVDRYVDPSTLAHPQKPKIALLFCHANGYVKEIWRPIMRRLRSSFRDSSRYALEFWAFDCRNQGDSAALNTAALDDHFDWSDYARDVLQVIDALGIKHEALALVGVGHSFGGTAIVMAEHFRPGTFDVLIPLDPVIYPNNVRPFYPGTPKSNPPAMRSSKRRDHWPSRDVAREKFLKNEFYQSWDPEMVEIYVQYGLRDVVGSTTGEVTLKCPKEQEFVTFMWDKNTAYYAFDALRHMDVPVRFVFAECSQVVLYETGVVVACQPRVTSAIILPRVGHLVVMQSPDDVVRVIGRALHLDVVAKFETEEGRRRSGASAKL